MLGMKEYKMIIKACVIFHTVDGKIYEIPCHRHGDAYYIIKQFINQNEILKEDTEEGFWNENAEFLDMSGFSRG